MIRANTCPHCGGPYTLTKPCTCVGMTAQHAAINSAIDGDPGEENEPLVVRRNPRRAPEPAPFAVGTKLRYIGKHIIHTAFGGSPGTMILGPGLEVVIDRVVAGRRGTGEPLRDEDGPMVDDDGEPYIDKTKDGYSVYSITDATIRKRSGRCIHADSAHEWEVIS